MRKTKNYLKKLQMTLRNYIHFLEEGKEKRQLDMCVFSAEIKVSKHILKVNFHSTMGILVSTNKYTIKSGFC